LDRPSIAEHPMVRVSWAQADPLKRWLAPNAPEDRAIMKFLAIAALALSGTSAGAAAATQAGTREALPINTSWVVSPEEIREWASVKNTNLPTLTGSPQWLHYLAFLEENFPQYDLVDLTHNSWQFERWSTSTDNRDWSLISDGCPARVASYGAYSGSTGPAGIGAELRLL
jgi:hypothetical protein